MWVSDPTTPRRRDFGDAYWRWCASITAASQASGLGRHWRQSIWPRTTVWKWMRRRYDGGCWMKDCARGSGKGSHTGRGDCAGDISANWCKWTVVLKTGWKHGGREGV